MKKYIVFGVTAAVSSALVFASIGSADQGRRIAGPICVDKSTGVVRAVAEVPFQKCRPNEIRRYGLKIKVTNKTIIVKGTAGPKGATGLTGAVGPAGVAGAPGPVGPAGPAGPAGKDGVGTGVAGPAGPAGPVGPAGAKGDTGATGAASTVPGPAGATGPQGPAGAPGTPGATGPAGADGAAGLGNGIIYACVSNGGSLQLSVNGQPCGGNNGHSPIKLVVVN